MIHQTAVIGSGAKIGANVEIGPHSVIGGAVTIADDCVIGANVVIEGEVSIGRRNRIGHGAMIGGEPQDVSFSPTTPSRRRSRGSWPAPGAMSQPRAAGSRLIFVCAP